MVEVNEPNQTTKPKSSKSTQSSKTTHSTSQSTKSTPSTSQSASQSSKSQPTSQSTKSTQPTTQSTNSSKSTSQSAKSSQSSPKLAAEVLAQIPDAELPEVDDTKKFNFFAKSEPTTSLLSSVELPKCAPNCLTGLTIVFTGTLPRLDRTESENIAKLYGAKVTKSISGKTSVVVIGDEAGPSKVKKIKQLKIKAIDEEGFIELLAKMPAEGGDSDAALRAKAKREEEMRKIEEEAREEAKKEDGKNAAKEKNAAKNSNTSNNSENAAKNSSNDSSPLWTTKYAPTALNHLCGNKGAINKLQTWLRDWFTQDPKKRMGACLISGPPGIGKTTAAHLIAKSLGYDVLEKNALDVRSKLLLNTTVKGALNNTSVVGFFERRGDVDARKFVLIMDEVDGMSSGDHGGAGQLAQFCRVTKMPMILICNDRLLPKMRVFDKVTLDIRFQRPLETDVRLRLMLIAFREGIKLEPAVIGQMVQATNHDMRQMINMMSTVARTQKHIGVGDGKALQQAWQKQTVLKPFDIVLRLLSSTRGSLDERINLYFNDIDFTPLMVQENYMSTGGGADHLERVAAAADSISEGDLVNTMIRLSEQQWSLLPFHAVMSLVRPAALVAGPMRGPPQFTSWLGQNLKGNKYQRLLQEVQYHTRLRTQTDKELLRMDYMPVMAQRLSKPFETEGEGGIGEVIDAMDAYYLSKEDWETVMEFGGKKVDLATKVKTAFTRRWNLQPHPVAIYKTGNSVSAPTKQKADFEGVVEEEAEEEPDAEKEELDVKKDKLVKVKARKSGEGGPKKKRAKK